MKSVSFLLAGALALAASQSFAEVANSSQPDWKAANNAFRDGAHGNFTPTTPQQKLQCAAYWLAWKSEIGTQMVPYVQHQLLCFVLYLKYVFSDCFHTFIPR